ncbi:MAG: toxin, partial [Clostridiales bacterium]
MSSIYYISEKADALIKKYDTRDPLALCRELRIQVRYKDLGTAVKAYYFYQSRIKNIVLNSRSGSIVQKVLCAHELGHAVLHGKLAAMRG